MDAAETLTAALATHSRAGHFVHESGLHGDLWLDLDGMLADADRAAQWAGALARKGLAMRPQVVCGPETGGARLAEHVGRALGVPSIAAVRVEAADRSSVHYQLQDAARPVVKDRRVLVVDDAINAGSAVRATIEALSGGSAIVVGIGCLIALHARAEQTAIGIGVPFVALLQLDQSIWKPEACPLCKSGRPVNPIE